jgi:hypothetical protein
MFGISAGQRILVATLGSYDEERAAEIVGARKHEKEPLFASQLDWIRWLIDLLRQRHDLFLIIRVHPREFPNKRDAVLSHHALELRAAFEDLPVNVAINWPDKKLSMYDLADCADAFLNSWSSVGKEMALLGLPTVMYAPQLSFYPAELGFWGDTERTYRDAIDRALASGWSFERARYAYRWFVCDFVRATLEIGESFPKGEGSARGTVQRVVEAVDRRWLPGLEQLWDISRRSYGHDTVRELDRFFRSGATTLLEVRPVVQTSELDERREEAAIRDGLKEIANVLFPTSHSTARSRLYPHLVGLRG